MKAMRKRFFLFCLLLCLVLICCTAFGKGVDGNVKELLQGFWAPRDYGTRIEITDDNLLVLWRNRPVLLTRFSVKKDMDARDNIIKIAKFEASNAKSAADF